MDEESLWEALQGELTRFFCLRRDEGLSPVFLLFWHFLYIVHFVVHVFFRSYLFITLFVGLSIYILFTYLHLIFWSYKFRFVIRSDWHL